MDIPEFDSGPETEGKEYGELVRGIDPFDINSWVCFGITQFLCHFQDLSEIRPFLSHPGEDIVAGAVQDAEYRGKVVGGQVPFDGGKNRNAATHCRLIKHFNSV